MKTQLNTMKYQNDGAAIQVGGLLTSSCETKAGGTDSSSYNGDTIVEVQDSGGSGAWIVIGTSNSTPTAGTGAYIPPNGITRPFILPANHKIRSNSGSQINIRPLGNTA
tara:strand:+ start:1448 stop:1774 length:327 start_codon:yes stop_codon:yes gene_type:complete